MAECSGEDGAGLPAGPIHREEKTVSIAVNRKIPMPWDAWVLAGLTLAFSLPLLCGFSHNFVFFPQRVASGEWWRLLTHPFVHVSWYHLLLDGVAFMALYSGLTGRTAARRIASVVPCVAVSVMVSVLAAPELARTGLCGLSGAAHGLAAMTALELLGTGGHNKCQAAVGMAVFLAVVAKSMIEAITGQVVFASLHGGLVGIPVAVCHAGGVLGGILSAGASYRLLSHSKERRPVPI